MPKKIHPADIANANIVAAAVRFDIALFLGAGRYATDTAATLDEARAKAARLAASNPNGRHPLIYGVTADGRSGLVTHHPIQRGPSDALCWNGFTAIIIQITKPVQQRPSLGDSYGDRMATEWA